MPVSTRRLGLVASWCLLVFAVLLWLATPADKPAPLDIELPSLEPDYAGQTLPNFAEYPAGPVRKKVFTEFLAPLVQQANRQVIELRNVALTVAATELQLTRRQMAWLAALCEAYRVETPCKPSEQLADEVATRINAVPVALAIAQGAKESGWGTSRFAREGNNLFGHWCFKAGCGLVPKHRNAGADHEVAVFDAPVDAIAAYIKNINSHRAYADVRQYRLEQGLAANAMAQGLSRYSERGQDYVDEVQTMLRQNPSWLDWPEVAATNISAE